MWLYLELLLISTFTSTFAGVLGIGGGLMLIAILPAFVSAGAIVPLHSVTQITSNASRALFALASVEWRYLPGFVLGSLMGVAVFGYVLYQVSTQYIPLFIGGYLLLNIWSKKFGTILERYESIFLMGFVQTGLGLLVGATGPLAMSMLLKETGDKEKVVATSAMLMTVTHLFKISFFGVLGFAYGDYMIPLIMLAAGALLGSFIGTRIRGRISSKHFMVVLKIILTLLAIRMICRVFV
jgi:uncharacterized membrane protein YfcA